MAQKQYRTDRHSDKKHQQLNSAQTNINQASITTDPSGQQQNDAKDKRKPEDTKKTEGYSNGEIVKSLRELSDTVAGLKSQVEAIKLDIDWAPLKTEFKSFIGEKLTPVNDKIAKINLPSYKDDFNKINGEISDLKKQLNSLNGLTDKLSSVKSKIGDSEKNLVSDIHKLWNGDGGYGLNGIIERVKDIQKNLAVKIGQNAQLAKDLEAIKAKINNVYNEASEIDRNIKSLKSTIADTSGKITDIEKDIPKQIESGVKTAIDENLTYTIKSAVERNINETIRISLEEKLAERMKKVIDDNISRQMKNSVQKCFDSQNSYLNDKEEKRSSTNRNYLFWSFAFILFVVVSSVFTAKGYLVGIDNLALLKSALSFVIITVICVIIFNCVITIFELFDNEAMLIAYYITCLAFSLIAFGLSCAVLLK